MKNLRYILLFLTVSATIGCTKDDKNTDFGVDRQAIDVDPEGGVQSVRITAGSNWIATSDNPWITISPANGRGSAECEIIIDSALMATTRVGAVRFQELATNRTSEITVSQGGFDYGISVGENEVTVKNYAPSSSRYFDVTVNTNVDFDVVIPSDQPWLSYDKDNFNVDLDRGVRPRDVTVRFKWSINSRSEERFAEVRFEPKASVELTRQDNLHVTQEAAEAVDENTRSADSIALLALARNMNAGTNWENGEAMDYWSNVQLWEEGMDGYTPEKKGRVRYARFFIFNTDEGIPFEVQYLTAADHLSWYSNGNKFLKDLDTGEYICKLTQLRRLEIGSYGLVDLHEDFVNLKNLESLDLNGNNFQKVPDILTPENFPNLRSLYLNTNQRRVIYDLSNTTWVDYGGLQDEGGLPVRLLEWNLDTLTLNVNYLQGELPTFEGPEWSHWPVYTAEDIAAVDTLPAALLGTPKVMTKTRSFKINLNRFYGEAPFWLLYHPALDWWGFGFIFTQEGKATNGISAGFSNEPINLKYYYEFYDGMKKNPWDEIDD